MQTPPDIPHGGWHESWIQWIITAILASSGWIKFWHFSKKTDSDIHETDARTERTHAETRKLNFDNSADLGQVMGVLIERQMAAQEAADARRERYLAQIDDLQSRLVKKEAEETAERAGKHRAMAEVQRCIMAIRDYEELLRAKDYEQTPFKIKTYEDIIGR